MRNLNANGMMDMTQGKPLKLILLFSVPLLIGNLFQQLYNMVDSMVVGNFVGKEALAAVGTGFPIIFMMSSLFIGISTGATIIISQYYGAKQIDQVKRCVDTIYTSMMCAALPLTILAILVSGPMLTLMNVPEDTWQQAWIYMAIVSAGLIGNLGFNMNSGILQGLGDSKTPLRFLSIACIINIILDLCFVIILRMGVSGVAWATIIAQIFSWIYGILYINKRYPQLHIQPLSIRFDKVLFLNIMRLGLPAGIQQALFSVGTMMIQSLVNTFGSAYMAGFNAANKLDTFAFMPVQSFANATTTFVGQNIGAQKSERVHQGTRSALMISIIFCIIALLLIPAGPFFMKLFSTDPIVISSGMAYLNRLLPFYVIFAAMFVLNAVMRGAGEVMIPMLSSVLSLWLARVPAAYLFAHYFGRDNMHFCYVAGWIPGLIIVLVYYLSGRWKNKAIVQQKPQEKGLHID